MSLMITTLHDAIELVLRLFPEVARNAADAPLDTDGLPQPLVELYARLGNVIGAPIDVFPLSRRNVASARVLRKFRFLQSQDALMSAPEWD